MRSSWLGTAGIALACLPCLLVLFGAAGVATGALSVIGSALSQPGLAIIAGFLAVLLFAGAAAAFARRRADAACETDFTPAARDELSRRTGQVAGPPGEEPRT